MANYVFSRKGVDILLKSEMPLRSPVFLDSRLQVLWACKATTPRSPVRLRVLWKYWTGMTGGRPARFLQDSANDSAIDAYSGAICGRSQRTGEIDDHISDFLRARESLEEGGRANAFEEFFFEGGRVRTFLRAHLRDESFDAFGPGGTR